MQCSVTSPTRPDRPLDLASSDRPLISAGTAVTVAPGPVSAPTASSSVAGWFEYIRPDFIQGNIATIAGAKKLIEAKRALKGCKGGKGGFTLLVETLGMDLGKAERLMVIARHPVLSKSAHAPILPLSWMTQYTLAKISPEVLDQLIADGRINPHLERKEAECLVELARGRNSTNGGRAEVHPDGRGDGGEHPDVGDDGHDDDHDDGHDAGHGDDRDAGHDEDCDDAVGHAEPHGGEDHDQRADGGESARDDFGPNSQNEIDRKLARAEELEREMRLWEIQRSGFESDIQELKALLDETSVPHQRRLFRQALRSLQKAESSDINEKEKRFLRASATTDFVEFVRSAARDGLGLNRFDIVCRPETH